MDLTELASGGAAIDFNGVGSTVEGTLLSIGEWRDIEGKFGTKVKAPFNLSIDDEERTLWVARNSRLATVIGSAFKEAGLTTITTGGTLKIQRIDDQPTNKGNPMHDYRAKYTPAIAGNTDVSIGELEEPF